MKKALLSVALTLISTTYPSTFLDTYTQLQKNPRYRKMSPLEIAIDRGDFEAIKYFEYRANLDELKKARVLLQNKIAGIDEIIKDEHTEFLNGPEKVDALKKVEESRRSKNSYVSLMREFERKIESTEKEEELRKNNSKVELPKPS